MLRLELLLIPKGNEREKSCLETFEICNESAATDLYANYSVKMRGLLNGNMKIDQFNTKRGRLQLIKDILNQIELDLTKL